MITMEQVSRFCKAYPLGSYERLWAAQSSQWGVTSTLLVYVDLPPRWRIRIDDLISTAHPRKLSPPPLHSS
jgi:hypothetical protein